MDTFTALKKEIFKEVWGKAAAQGFERSMLDEATCAYRSTKDGKQMCCNVGFLIPDEEYNSGIEDNGISPDIFARTTAYKRGQKISLTEPEMDKLYHFLSELQGAHDDADDAAEHKSNLSKLAVVEGLFEAPAP